MVAFSSRHPDEIRPEIAAMSPLEVLLRAMAIEANQNNWSAAADHAAKAAPYLHPRLANETHRIEHGFGDAETDELLRELAELRTAQGVDDPARAAGQGDPRGSVDLVH